MELEHPLTFLQARDRELNFFRSQYPWNTLPDLQHRMGTPQLTKELSKLLANLIDQASVFSSLGNTMRG